MSTKTAARATDITRSVEARDLRAGTPVIFEGQRRIVRENEISFDKAEQNFYRNIRFEDGLAITRPERDHLQRDESFAVGEGATERLYTDSHAYTVIKVSPSGKTITIQRDTATLSPDFKPETILGGFVGHTVNQHEQSYTYEADPEGATFTARYTKRGWTTPGGSRIGHGRHEFYDYNF
jgi:hypothetical protein